MEILKDDHPSLLKKTQLVSLEEINDLSESIEQMKQLLKSLPHGMAIAANQVGINKRLFVMKLGESIKLFINPTIIKRSDDLITWEERCLSYEEKVEKTRNKWVKLRWYDLKLKQYREKKYHGVRALCIQHEVDHLNGVRFLDE